MRRIAVILAGGRSRRMEGRDKAVVRIGGGRMVERVAARLAAQADRTVISGPHNYGTTLTAIPDAAMGPHGPAGGIISVWRWMATNETGAEGFFSAPVDAPFLPEDLIARLAQSGGPAIAADDEGVHPTFAYWSCTALESAWPAVRAAPSLSLRALAGACRASKAVWPGAGAFCNVNTPEDLAAALARNGEQSESRAESDRIRTAAPPRQ